MGAGDVEHCKALLPPSVPTTNAASPPRVPLGSLVFNTPTATPSRRTLKEGLGSAEALRSADMVKRAWFAQKTDEQRPHKIHHTKGGLFLQHLDATSFTGEHNICTFKFVS